MNDSEDIEYGIPPELWVHVSTFLQPRDLVHLACTSQTMRAAVLPRRVLGCKPFKIPKVFIVLGIVVVGLIVLTTLLPIGDYFYEHPDKFTVGNCFVSILGVLMFWIGLVIFTIIF